METRCVSAAACLKGGIIALRWWWLLLPLPLGSRLPTASYDSHSGHFYNLLLTLNRPSFKLDSTSWSPPNPSLLRRITAFMAYSQISDVKRQLYKTLMLEML